MSLARRTVSRTRSLMRRLRRRTVILSYHRVADVPVDPWGLAVSPGHFAEQLEVIRRVGVPTRLQDLVAGIGERRVPRRGVVLTFDDGYADNLRNAKPLLSRCDVPATVFLTAGKLGMKGVFWWEEMTDLFFRPGALPPTLEVDFGGRRHRWELGDAAEYSAEDARRHAGWRGWWPERPTARHRIYADLFALLQPAKEPARNDLMAALRLWAGISPPSSEAAPVLTVPEAASLGEGDLVEIGGHTMNHPRLSSLTDDEQRAEVLGSRESLERIVGRPVTSFAYPYGGVADYDARSVSIVRESGFTAACSTAGGSVIWKSDPLELPRQHVGDWGGAEFESRLSGWLRAA